jgi:hypothetical protein
MMAITTSNSTSVNATEACFIRRITTPRAEMDQPVSKQCNTIDVSVNAPEVSASR